MEVGPCDHPRARGCRPILDLTFRYIVNIIFIIMSSVMLILQDCQWAE